MAESQEQMAFLERWAKRRADAKDINDMIKQRYKEIQQDEASTKKMR